MNTTPPTLPVLFGTNAAAGGDALALSMDGHPGLTWREYARQVARLAPGFVGLGVRPGEPVALLSGPRPEFHVVDTALLHARAVPFSLQESDPVERLARNLNVTNANILVVEERLVDLARQVTAALGRPITLVGLDHASPGFLSLDAVAKRGTGGPSVEQLRAAIDPEDIATLIFTSGTTGEPKAVQLSHRAIVISQFSTHKLAPFHQPGHEGVVLSYLPLNHIAERFMSHYAQLTFGLAIHCVPNPDTLYDTIRKVRPTRFFGVPRVYEKLTNMARDLIEADPALTAASAVNLRRVRAEQSGQSPSAAEVAEAEAALASLARVRESLGLDRAEYVGVATAPSAYAMLEFLLAIGLRISDIWGLSEAIMCTLNPPNAIRLGTVGRFLDGVEGRIAEDGEILVRGPNVFSGYLNDPEQTRQIWHDGWIHTGDVGSIEDGYLRILGRKKEMLITATGKNIAPAVIENALKSASPLIDYAVAIADNQRYVTALVALDPQQLRAFTGRPEASFAELAASPEVRQAIADAVEAANRTLSRPESVRAFHIVDTPWTPGGDELTATGKLRRDVIAKKYAEQIEQLYR
jgi:long-subunit acyl-CoA synthetase (AMP-forming)